VSTNWRRRTPIDNARGRAAADNLLGRLRVALMRASFASLMEQVADAVKFFETTSGRLGFRQQANTAKSPSVRTADDIVQHTFRTESGMLDAIFDAEPFLRRTSWRRAVFAILDRIKARSAGELPGSSNCSTPAWSLAFRACTRGADGVASAGC